MQITQATPPKEPTRARITHRRSYRSLFDTLRINDGAWLAINPVEITGPTVSRKQTGLYLAAQVRKMQIQTTYQDGVLYVRTICEQEGSNA
jgi:hypothetical protein